MKQFIIKLSILLASILTLVSFNTLAYAAPAPTVGNENGAAAPAQQAATDPTCGNGSNSAKGQVLQGIGNTGNDCTGTGVTNIIAAVVEILSYIVGVASVIVVILAGFRYITSAGDSNKVAGAKTTLIYALVGIVVAALAQFLIRAVFHTAVKTG